LQLSATYTKAIPFLAPQSPGFPATNDLAAFHATSSSSTDHNAEYGSESRKAVDGNNSTYWKSQNSDPQWLVVDLGGTHVINRVQVTWARDRFGDSFAKAYAIQISDDGNSWKEVRGVVDGRGGAESNECSPVPARWVRVFCTKRAANQSYKIVSLEVFGPSQ
jgi:hypothetical protein